MASELVQVVRIAEMRMNDTLRATLGDNILVGRAIGFGKGQMKGTSVVYLNPLGEIRGFALDDTWTFELIGREGDPT